MENSRSLASACRAIASVALLAAVLTACGKADVGVEDASPASKVVNDFLKTEILLRDDSAGVADGVTELYVLVRLMNSNSKVVKGFRPTYEISVGDGVIVTSCSESDANGISVCPLKATIPGVKTFSLLNVAKLVLKKDVTFDPKPAGQAFGFVAAGKTAVSATKWKVQAAIGQELSSVKVTSQPNGAGWKLYGTVQGNLISE